MEGIAAFCEGRGDPVGAVVARSTLSGEQAAKLQIELPRILRGDGPMDAKNLADTIRKLGGTVAEPAATKRKSHEVIEIQDSSVEKASSSEDEDEKPSPAKKAKAADPEEDAELICRPKKTGKDS